MPDVQSQWQIDETFRTMTKGTYGQPNSSGDAERYVRRWNHSDHWRARIQSVLQADETVVGFIEAFCSMMEYRIHRRTVIEHWPRANEKDVFPIFGVPNILTLYVFSKVCYLTHLFICCKISWFYWRLVILASHRPYADPGSKLMWGLSCRKKKMQQEKKTPNDKDCNFVLPRSWYGAERTVSIS